MLAVCGTALWVGDRPAKWAGAACLAAWFGTYLVQNRHDFFNPQYAAAGVDIVLLACLIALAMIYRRSWLMAAGGFHMLGVATHFAFLIDHRVAVNAYLTAAYIWAYLTLAAVAWGTWTSWRARRLAKTTDRS